MCGDNGSFSGELLLLGGKNLWTSFCKCPGVPQGHPPFPGRPLISALAFTMIYEVVRVGINRVPQLLCLRPRKKKTDNLTKRGRGSRLNSTKYRYSRWGRCSGSKSTKTRRARWTKNSRICHLANSKASKCWSRTWRCTKRKPTSRWRLAGRNKQCHGR